MLQVVAGYDPADPSSIHMSVPDYRSILRRGASALRVGVPRALFFSDLHPDVESAMENALVILRRITRSIQDVVLPSPPDKQDAFRNAVLAAESHAYHHELLNKSPDLYQPETLSRLRTGAEVTTVAYIQGLRAMAQARREIDQIFNTVDVLVTPTTPLPPPTIADSRTDVSTSLRLYSTYTRNTLPFNVYGIPAISVLCGFTSTGLPIGLQICARSGADAVVLQLAAAYERASDWYRRTPDLSGV